MTRPDSLLLSLISEIDHVTSGGDDPRERCPECGLAGVGMLRDARREAVEYLVEVGVVRRGADGRIERVIK